jgi:transcriptional regulator with XRE-family HTH domain
MPTLRNPNDSSNAVQTFGANVRRARKHKDFTQAELAILIGLSQGHVSKIERGLENPGLPLCEAFAKALGCPLEFLLTQA